MKFYAIGICIMLLAIAVSACVSNNKALRKSHSYPEKIHWPQAYAPEDASFFVHNTIDINASPETVWNILIRAEAWPKWYQGASNVKVQNGTGMLAENAIFTWTTMGLDFTSTIKEFKPLERLSWESRKSTIKGYHAWLIIPKDSGCTLVTDESQHGFLTFFEKLFQPNKLRELHDIWLSQIKFKAETHQIEVQEFSTINDR